MQTKSRKSSFFTTELTDNSERTSIKKSRSNHENLEQQKEMAQKALHFIARLRTNKKEFDGKIHMIKRAQAERRLEEQKRREIEMEVQKELKRKIRRMKAEVNIEFYKEKNSQQNASELNSPRKRKLSSVSEQSQSISPRVRLPSIYNQPGLQQIKEQQSEKVPLGIQKTVRKQAGLIRRARTQKSDYYEKDKQQEFQQAEQLKLLSGSKKSTLKFRLRSEQRQQQKQKDDNKKSYLMSRNRTGDISEYLAQFSNLSHFQKLGSQGKNEKKVSQLKNVFKAKKTPRINLNKSKRNEGGEFEFDKEDNRENQRKFSQSQNKDQPKLQ